MRCNDTKAGHRSGGYIISNESAGGIVKPAFDGALVGMAAGDRATFDRVRPLLDEMTRRLDFLVMWAMRRHEISN